MIDLNNVAAGWLGLARRVEREMQQNALFAERGEDGRPTGLYTMRDPANEFRVVASGLALEEAMSWGNK